MITDLIFLPEQLIQALGWSLVHCLWQGTVVSLLLGCILWTTHRHSARSRYLISVSALAVLLVVWLSTLIMLLASPVTPEQVGAGLSLGINTLANAAPETAGPISHRFFPDYFDRHLPLLVTFWLMGLLILGLRLLGGLAWTRRLRHYRVQPAPPWVERRVQWMCRILKIRAEVSILQSAMVQTPMVIGHLKPVILLPLGVITQIPREQLEGLLLHELAHVMRKDYLVNILQSVMETLLFFHPAVWWISARIRTEREHCCDDIAVAVTGDPLTFARALANIKEVSMQVPQAAMAATGGKGHLLTRIQRTLGKRPTGSSTLEKLAAVLALFVCMSLLTINASSPAAVVQLAPPAPEAPQATPVVAEYPQLADVLAPTPQAAAPAPEAMPEPVLAPVATVGQPKPVISPATFEAPPAPGGPAMVRGPATINFSRAPAPGPGFPALVPGISAPAVPGRDDSVRTGTWRFVEEGSDVEIKFRNGEMTQLFIDGEEIESSDWAQYRGLIDRARETQERAEAEALVAEAEMERQEKEMARQERDMARQEAEMRVQESEMHLEDAEMARQELITQAEEATIQRQEALMQTQEELAQREEALMRARSERGDLDEQARQAELDELRKMRESIRDQERSIREFEREIRSRSRDAIREMDRAVRESRRDIRSRLVEREEELVAEGLEREDAARQAEEEIEREIESAVGQQSEIAKKLELELKELEDQLDARIQAADRQKETNIRELKVKSLEKNAKEKSEKQAKEKKKLKD